MKKTALALCAVSLLAVLAATGCTSTMSMPGGMMQSNIPLTQGGYTILNDGQPVTGSAKTSAWATPFGMRDDSDKSSRWRTAIDQALAQCPGADALINITTDVKMKTTTYLYFMKMEYETIITGTPVKISNK